MWIWFEGIVVVIQEYAPWRARKNHGMPGTGTLQGSVMARFNSLEMRWIEFAQSGFIDVFVNCHGPIITSQDSLKGSIPARLEFQSTRNLGIIYGFTEWSGEMYESRFIAATGAHD
jgi:hypothetical protein